MVWNEHAQDSMFYSTQEDVDPYSSDEEPPPVEGHYPIAPDYPVHVEPWTDWYSSDLWNMWNLITTYARDNGITCNVLRNATYTDFCEWCYAMSEPACGRASNYP